LEEAAQADLLLNVCDVSSPEAEEHLKVTAQLLKDLKADHIPMLTVLNKCDKLAYQPLDLGRDSVLISARTGFGIENLLQNICRMLPPTQQRLTLLLPYAKGGLENHIVETGGKIFSREYTEEGILLDALVSNKELHRVADFVQRNP
jgi:GTP-binding protein HflX